MLPIRGEADLVRRWRRRGTIRTRSPRGRARHLEQRLAIGPVPSHRDEAVAPIVDVDARAVGAEVWNAAPLLRRCAAQEADPRRDAARRRDPDQLELRL